MANSPSDRFDVFLSHSSADKPAVEELARRLEHEGLRPWLDKWNLIPGEPWQPEIEEVLMNCGAVAVFIGPGPLGPWHHEEMRQRSPVRSRIASVGKGSAWSRCSFRTPVGPARADCLRSCARTLGSSSARCSTTRKCSTSLSAESRESHPAQDSE